VINRVWIFLKIPEEKVVNDNQKRSGLFSPVKRVSMSLFAETVIIKLLK